MLRKRFITEILFILLLKVFVLPETRSIVTRTILNQRCSLWMNSTTFDPKSCARFYVCVLNHWILKQCQFPLLYSTETQMCQDPTQDEVDCHNRSEPLTPCDYSMSSFFTTLDGQCLTTTEYSDLDYTLCITKRDGRYPYPDRPWSPFYILCTKRRTFPMRCNQGDDIIYDPIKKECFLIYSVVKEFNLLKSANYELLSYFLNIHQTPFSLLHAQLGASISNSISESLSLRWTITPTVKSEFPTKQSTIAHTLNSELCTSSVSESREYTKEANTKHDNIAASNKPLQSMFDLSPSHNINLEHEEISAVSITDNFYQYKISEQYHYTLVGNDRDSELFSSFSPHSELSMRTQIKTSSSEPVFQKWSLAVEATGIQTASLSSFQNSKQSSVGATHIKTTPPELAFLTSGRLLSETSQTKTIPSQLSFQPSRELTETIYTKTIPSQLSFQPSRELSTETIHTKTPSELAFHLSGASLIETTHSKTNSELFKTSTSLLEETPRFKTSELPLETSRGSSLKNNHIKTSTSSLEVTSPFKTSELPLDTSRGSSLKTNHIKTNPPMSSKNKEIGTIMLTGTNELIKPSPASECTHTSHVLVQQHDKSALDGKLIVFTMSGSIAAAVCVTVVGALIIIKFRLSKKKSSR